MKQALLVIDIQNIYFSERGMYLHKPVEAAQNAERLIEHFRQQKKAIVFIKHNFHYAGVQTDGVDFGAFYESIAPKDGEIIINKDYPSSFRKTDLKAKLDEIGAEELVVVGNMTHMCVDTTVRAAMDFDYHVILVEDACTTKDLTYRKETFPAELVHKVLIAALSGTFADVMTTREYLEQK